MKKLQKMAACVTFLVLHCLVISRLSALTLASLSSVKSSTDFDDKKAFHEDNSPDSPPPFFMDSNSLDELNHSSGRNRRYLPPMPKSSSDEIIEAYVDQSVIVKLDRNLFLKDMTAKANGKTMKSRADPDPVEFFPSLDGKPRWV